MWMQRLLTTLPVSEGTASEVRKDLEHKLIDCDALIVLYGETTLAWVEKQLLYCNKMAPKREKPFLTPGCVRRTARGETGGIDPDAEP